MSSHKKAVVRKAGRKRVAAKAAGRAVPAVGQALMVLEGAPVAAAEGSRFADHTREYWKEVWEHAKNRDIPAVAKTVGRRQVAATRELTEGVGRTALAAIVAREAADAALLGRRNPDVFKYLPEQQKILPIYQTILAGLLGVREAYREAHWVAPSYGDHLLYERLKGSVEDSIDQLGERMVLLFGGGSVQRDVIRKEVRKFDSTAQSAAGKGASKPQILWTMERILLSFLGLALRANQDQAPADMQPGNFTSGTSVGMDTLLSDIAAEREQALYLLRQRIGF